MHELPLYIIPSCGASSEYWRVSVHPWPCARSGGVLAPDVSMEQPGQLVPPLSALFSHSPTCCAATPALKQATAAASKQAKQAVMQLTHTVRTLSSANQHSSSQAKPKPSISALVPLHTSFWCAIRERKRDSSWQGVFSAGGTRLPAAVMQSRVGRGKRECRCADDGHISGFTRWMIRPHEVRGLGECLPALHAWWVAAALDAGGKPPET